MILLRLFLTFAFIGAFSFGGGYSMLTLIQEEVVLHHNWLNIQKFSDIVAISEMTPGPIAINAATYVGYRTAGFPGSLAATVGVILPSFFIVLALAKIVLKNKENPYFQGAFSGLRPVIVVLIIGASLRLGTEIIADFKSLILTIAAIAIIFLTKIHPVLIILGFGLIGILM